MQKFYSTPHGGGHSAIVKSFLTTLFFFLFLGFSEVKAQTGTNLSYDGADDYTALGNDVVLGLNGDYTIEFWVYWRGGPAYQRVFDFGAAGDPFTAPWIFFTPDIGSNVARFAISTNGLGTPQTVDASTALPQNAWTHVALVQTGGTMSIYFNGISVGSWAISIHPADLGSTTQNWLGQSQFGGDPHFNGQIEELRISSTARYSGPFTPSTTQYTVDGSTVALYHFNEGVGTTTADATVNFNATLGNPPANPTWVVGSPLPIRINSISAAINNNGVDIKWSASLDRESEFVIERSSNGTNFSQIGSVNRSTGTQGSENFSFRDNKPVSGRSYYRLKCTEAGSASFYSKMVAVVLSGKEEVIVYPNPVKGNTITVELPKAYTGKVELSFTSASGALVFKQLINAVEKKDFQVPRTAAIIPGTYLLEINTGGIKRTKTIICQ